MKTTVGSRDSVLALAQAQHVMAVLQQHLPEQTFTLKTYKTQGDLLLDRTLSQLGDKGLFVKELEQALLAGEIDLAVHSMKDMPATLPPGLQVVPFGKRESPWDALISRNHEPFEALPAGARVGTASLRRQAVLQSRRPDLCYAVVRGNVLTRLDKLDQGLFDALVLAQAGLNRLNLSARVTETLSPEVMLPACGQGTLAIEFADPNLEPLLSALTAPETAIATRAERAFLTAIQGGCQVPLAAYAAAHPDDPALYRLTAMLASVDGHTQLYAHEDFLPEAAESAGERVAEALLKQGGQILLENLPPLPQRP